MWLVRKLRRDLRRKQGKKRKYEKRTCGWVARQKKSVLKAWCGKTRWFDDVPPASHACQKTCDTCSADSSPAPAPICSENRKERFFYKVGGADGITEVTRTCAFLKRLKNKERKQICNIVAPGNGSLSAKDVCPQTCDNCCAVENDHYKELVEHYETLLTSNGISF